jgi:O-antigen/teichoic acid export membrane protein
VIAMPSNDPVAQVNAPLGVRFAWGALWTAIAVGLRLAIVAISLAILGRIVSAYDMGLFAVAWSVIGLASTFSQLGAARGLIQIPIVTARHEAAAFWLSLFLSLILGAIIAASSHLLAALFRNPALTDAFQIGSIFLPLMSIGASDTALQQRYLNFTWLSVVQVAGLLLSAAVSVTLALMGFKLFALFAVQGLTGIGMLIFFKMRRGARSFNRFGISELREIWGFGIHFSVGALSAYIAQNLPILLIARTLSVESVGLFSVAMRLVQMLVVQLGAVLTATLFPVLVRVKDDRERLGRAYIMVTKYAMLALLLSLGIFVVAPKEVLYVIVGPQWQDAAEILRILAIAQIIISFGTNVFPTFQALGRIDLPWKWNLLLIGCLTPAILLAVRFGPEGVAICLLLVNAPLSLLAVLLIHRALNLRVQQYGHAVAPSIAGLLASILAGLATIKLLPDVSKFVVLGFTISVMPFVFLSVAMLTDNSILKVLLGYIWRRKAKSWL